MIVYYQLGNALKDQRGQKEHCFVRFPIPLWAPLLCNERRMLISVGATAEHLQSADLHFNSGQQNQRFETYPCYCRSLALVHWSTVLNCYPFYNLSKHLPTNIT